MSADSIPSDHHFDAIVIGSGISGGWAAKELCEQGLKTLVLERGRSVVHVEDYPTAMMHPWQFAQRMEVSQSAMAEDPIQCHAYYYNEATKGFFVRDREHPYIQQDPYRWIRGYQVGGRSLVWGRQCYRLSDLDFAANLHDGHGVDWPIRYSDLAPWYDYVERFAGVSGRNENLAHLPDGQFLPPMEMNCIETHFSDRVRGHYADRVVTIGRVANLTSPIGGRGPCQYRNMCARGCPYGGYFSSNSATLPAAAATGNVIVLPDSIAVEILYDEKKSRASGVRVLDAVTGQSTEYFARVIFANASTINTAALLLRSVSARFPTGLGNGSNQIGHNLMDHCVGPGAYGQFDGYLDRYYSGRRPNIVYIPRFRNIGGATERSDYVRGFGCQAFGSRRGWREQLDSSSGFGSSYKEQLLSPGAWDMSISAFGETLPRFGNHISLDSEQKDKWGLPLVRVAYEVQDNERKMLADARQAMAEMLDVAGFRNVVAYDDDSPPGSGNHEMGTARMGREPGTSVLNAHNQMHEVPNVFVTDGSAMTSSACQNPSLTYMALTARACRYAVDELGRGNI